MFVVGSDVYYSTLLCVWLSASPYFSSTISTLSSILHSLSLSLVAVSPMSKEPFLARTRRRGRLSSEPGCCGTPDGQLTSAFPSRIQRFPNLGTSQYAVFTLLPFTARPSIRGYKSMSFLHQHTLTVVVQIKLCAIRAPASQRWVGSPQKYLRWH